MEPDTSISSTSRLGRGGRRTPCEGCTGSPPAERSCAAFGAGRDRRCSRPGVAGSAAWGRRAASRPGGPTAPRVPQACRRRGPSWRSTSVRLQAMESSVAPASRRPPPRFRSVPPPAGVHPPAVVASLRAMSVVRLRHRIDAVEELRERGIERGEVLRSANERASPRPVDRLAGSSVPMDAQGLDPEDHRRHGDLEPLGAELAGELHGIVSPGIFPGYAGPRQRVVDRLHALGSVRPRQRPRRPSPREAVPRPVPGPRGT